MPTATNTPVVQPPTPTNTPVPAATPTNTPAPPVSGSVTITAGGDTYVNSSSPTSNYGTSTALRADASPELRSYVKFDVQGVAGPVTRATLRIFANSALPAGIEIHGVTDTAWDERAITFSNAPAYSATVTGTSGAIATGTWLSIDITSLVQGNGVISIAITTPSSTQINLASRETGATAPQLIVEY